MIREEASNSNQVYLKEESFDQFNNGIKRVHVLAKWVEQIQDQGISNTLKSIYINLMNKNKDLIQEK